MLGHQRVDLTHPDRRLKVLRRNNIAVVPLAVRGRLLLRVFSRLFHELTTPDRTYVGLFVGFTLMCSVAELISISSLIPFISVLLAPEKMLESDGFVGTVFDAFGVVNVDDARLLITVGFTSAVVLSAVLRSLQLWLQIRLIQKFGSALAPAIFNNVLSWPLIEHLSRNSSEVLASVMKTNDLVENLFMPTLFLFSSSLISIAVFGLLLYFSPTASLAALAYFAIVFFALSHFLRGFSARAGARVSENQTATLNVMREGLGAIKELQITRQQSVFLDEFRIRDGAVRSAQTIIKWIGIGPRFLVEGVSIAGLAFVAYAMTLDNLNVVELIPFIGVFVFAAHRVLPLLQQIYISVNSIFAYSRTTADVDELLSHKSRSKPVKEGSVNFDKFKSIKFENVSFQYGGRNIALSEVNIELPVGKVIGLKGQTGSGKTTFVNLLSGLIEPSAGVILVDGENIHRSLSTWHESIYYMPQDCFIFDQSIEANITFGRGEATVDEESLAAALHAAQLTSFVESLDGHLAYPVGECGKGLSGGQRQRVGIARAIYSSRPLLILDEATSALDNVTAGNVIKSLKALQGKTVVIISHNQDELDQCDVILNFNDGKVSPAVQ